MKFLKWSCLILVVFFAIIHYYYYIYIFIIFFLDIIFSQFQFSELQAQAQSSPEDEDEDKDNDDDDENAGPSYTTEEKGKGKADPEQVDQEDERSNLVAIFSDLINKRDELIDEYEKANRTWNASNLEKDKVYMDRVAHELDAAEEVIKELSREYDLIDPYASEEDDEDE